MIYDFENLKITLIDTDESMCAAWKTELQEYTDTLGDCYIPNVEIVQSNIVEWLKENNNHLLGIVTPANSFGLMDGGFDGAVRKYFVEDYDIDIIPIVQEHLKKNYWGEQPVGSSTLVRLPVVGTYILHTPTMICPSTIVDARVVYHCTRSAILEALRTECTHIVLPAFGGCCGKVDPKIIAQYMFAGMYTFLSSRKLTWHDVFHDHILSDLQLM